MKLSDALMQFETRLAKATGGVVKMSAEDLVKYLGEQMTAADSEDAETSKARREAAAAVIAAAKAAEAEGATTFEVKVFVAPTAKSTEPSETKDPVLDALKDLATTVKGLKDGLDKAAAPAELKVDGDKLAKASEGKAPKGTEPAPDGEEIEKNDPAAKPFIWPTDLNTR